ncbi:conserved hypothetical protein [Chloroherpeton thalassium ATCC 35110]|uniref:DNA-directed RNA polymerase subunit omega n=1 Tax=Chloroherpeton thalassium (strain ATCC 35110 / GB-78) TaxID=517418 RepID=B3QXA3_CHLT3|nr:DNA-directed RNA polymerase subunit omega [Chloroherpeton thalassium]ACF13377.1 conserved hypothetical protein [Chloroherpeton thalassium ATCC 35110]
MSIRPVDFEDIQSQTDNVYEVVAAMGLRAKEINEEQRSELEEELAPYQVKVKNPASEGEADKVFPEQVAIAQKYEGKLKPTILSIEQYKNKEYRFYYNESSVASRRR